MGFVKTLFSILVSLPILVLGIWLCTRYVVNVLNKKDDTATDSADKKAQSRRNING